MLRKTCLLALLAVLITSAEAGRIIIQTFIAHTRSTTATSTIAAAGAGIKNCLTNLDAYSDADFTVRILDGGTTSYSLSTSSGSVLIRSWDEDHGFCGTNNTAMYITVSAGNPQVNYSGYTK